MTKTRNKAVVKASTGIIPWRRGGEVPPVGTIMRYTAAGLNHLRPQHPDDRFEVVPRARSRSDHSRVRRLGGSRRTTHIFHPSFLKPVPYAEAELDPAGDTALSGLVNRYGWEAVARAVRRARPSGAGWGGGPRPPELPLGDLVDELRSSGAPDLVALGAAGAGVLEQLMAQLVTDDDDEDLPPPPPRRARVDDDE